jgi:hypothetical protein
MLGAAYSSAKIARLTLGADSTGASVGPLRRRGDWQEGAALSRFNSMFTHLRSRGTTTEFIRMPLRNWLWTTPGILRTMSIVSMAMFVALGAIAGAVLADRRAASASVGSDSSVQLAEARELYVALADADATASSALLRDEIDSGPVRQRYLEDLDRAAQLAIAAADHADATPTARAATKAIAAELTLYAERVGKARAYSRLGDPVGAAYMRAASAQMREQVLPAAAVLWDEAAESLDHDYSGATDRDQAVVLFVAAAVALAAVVAVQIFLASRTNRILSTWLVGATVALVAFSSGTASLFAAQHHELAETRRDDADIVESLSSARMLALQLQADVNLALVGRETRDDYLAAFDETSGRLDHMLALATDRARGTRRARSVQASADAFVSYRGVADGVERRDDTGVTHDEAVDLALSDAPGGLAAQWRSLDLALSETIADAERDVTSASTEASRRYAVALASALAAITAAALLVGVGLHRRIEDYR